MNSNDWPVTITTADASHVAGVSLWQQRRQFFATVAIKATFTLVSGGTMTLRDPLPVESSERSLSQSIGIEPGDLAPCLVQPEIWVRGHAWHPPAKGAPSVRVRLVVGRDGQPILRKTVEIPIQQDPFVPPYLHAFAPLSRRWPIRTRLLGAFDWTNLDRSPMALPDNFDWNYFHATPNDQRLPPLRGDEWLRLEAMHSTVLKFDTQLPSATCAVMLFGNLEPFRQGVPLRVGLDTIQVDVDRGLCALVFRGHTRLPNNIALADLQFATGLGLADRIIPTLAPRKHAAYSANQSSSLLPARSSANETFALDAAILQSLLDQEALPFADGPSPLVTSGQQPVAKRDNGDAGQTFTLDERSLATLERQGDLPFHIGLPAVQSSPSNLSVSNESTEPSVAMVGPAKPEKPHPQRSIPDAENVASTFVISDEILAKLAENAAIPFADGVPLPERDEPPDIMSGLPFQSAPANEQAKGNLGFHFLAAMKDVMDVDETPSRVTKFG